MDFCPPWWNFVKNLVDFQASPGLLQRGVILLAFHHLLCPGITRDNGFGLRLGGKRIKSVGVHGHERNKQGIAITMTKRKRTRQSEGV